MPMNKDKMADDMLKLLRVNMKALSAKAEEMPFQEELMDAIAKGTIDTIKKLKAVGGGNSAAKSGVGLVVNPDLMIKTGLQTMQGLLGSAGGPALPFIMMSVFIPMAAHLASNVEVKSISGFGGVVGPPIGGVPPKFEKAITDSFKAETKKKLKTQKQGKNLIISIATGLSVGISAGIPGPIPTSGSDGGATIAIFK